MRALWPLLRGRTLTILAVVGLWVVGSAAAASAATFTVNDTRDLAQSGTAAPGTCVSTASTCTVRAAFQAANQNGGSNTINVPAGTYPINSTTTMTNGDLTTGSFKVNVANNSTQISIVGAGIHTTVINAQGMDRIFEVWPNGVLDVQKMTLENGDGRGSNNTTAPVDLPDGDGGAVASDGHLSAESVDFTGDMATAAGGGIAAENVSGSTVSITGSVLQNDSAPDGGAVFTDAPEDVTLGFSLMQANNGTDGGGVYGGVDAAGLTLNYDGLIQNVATAAGGAIWWKGDGALNITNSVANQNQASGVGADGGAIYNDAPNNFNISNSSFDGNSAAIGGAVDDEKTNGLTITQVKFSGNSATDGGAIEAASTNANANTTVTSSEFDSNSATSDTGGAIDWVDAPLTLQGDSFVLNSANSGGAINVASDTPPPGGDSVLTMFDTTISRNTASAFGGGINMDDGGADETAVTMVNDTIAFNNAPATKGGGIDDPQELVSGGSAVNGFGVENTTIAENSGGDCNQTFDPGDNVGNNDDGDQSCFGGLNGPNDKVGVNPMLSNPANNGGPLAGGPGDTVTLQTDAEQASSPTVDAGNNNGCPAVDERGVKRPQGKACDIGAFEFGASAPTFTTTTSRTTSQSTTTSTKPHKKPKRKKCPKGKVRKHGKCVKKHKKRHK